MAAHRQQQTLRRSFQLAFLALNLWIGVQFYLFVRYYEQYGRSVRVSRPPGVEGWLPVAALMDFKALLSTGELPRFHPAGVFLLIAFLAISWLVRKAFCSWLCPIGTLSEFLARVGRKTFRRNFRLPRKLDIGLRSLKYLLLAIFLYAVCSMSTPAIRAFLEGPYGLLDDVKMLNFFRFLGLTGGIVLALFVLASVFLEHFWCRYLCPYGALLGLVSLASPIRIRRDTSLCIDCGKCTRMCPSQLPVAQLIQIRSAECNSCLQCVDSCPVAGSLLMTAPKHRPVPAWAMAAAIVVIFVGICSYARLTHNWHTDIPDQIYSRLIPNADEYGHP